MSGTYSFSISTLRAAMQQAVARPVATHLTWLAESEENQTLQASSRRSHLPMFSSCSSEKKPGRVSLIIVRRPEGGTGIWGSKLTMRAIKMKKYVQVG